MSGPGALGRALLLAGVLAGTCMGTRAQEPAVAQLGPAPRITDPSEWATTAQEPAHAALSPVDRTSRQAVVDFYNNVYVPAAAVANDWSGSVTGCVPGTTSAAYADATMDTVNYFRAMTGLPAAVPRVPLKDQKSQAAALIMTANNALSHAPPEEWDCRTPDGVEAAGKSNLALGAAGARAVALYVQDPGTSNTALGHRRWILYPRQTSMGTGSSNRSNALWVIGDFGARPASPEVVAWPPAGFVPYRVVYPRWSFSVNTASTVSFTGASVAMSVDGASVPLTVLPNATGYGDNTIAWEPSGISFQAGMADRTYAVAVRNVLVDGKPRDYAYTVTVIDPAAVAVPVTLTVQRAGTGSGVVTSAPAGINCGSDCAEAYPPGTSVTLTATPSAGSIFSGWSGGGCSGVGPCTVGLTAAVTVTAGFSAVSAPTFTRYLAEGATSRVFDTRIAMLNPGTLATVATLSFLRAGQPPVIETVAVPAGTRVTLDPKTIAGLEAAEFSTTVVSDQLLVVDRTMGWADGLGYGAHTESAVAAPALTWYLAEGATHGGFNLFYLLQNPNDADAAVRVRYLRPSAPPLEKHYALEPRSRRTVWVDVEEFGAAGQALASTDVSAVIEVLNGQPIVVERAMYAEVPGQFFGAGHESAGVTAPATAWLLAEGATGPWFDLFVLLANPSGQRADARATFLLPSGEAVERRYEVAPNSRFTIWVDHEDPRLADTAVSTTIDVLNGVPLIVERAMWWPGDWTAWHEAHNTAGAVAAGTRWALAEGEVDASRGMETYILVANTGSTPATVQVTLLFEDGTRATRTYAGIPARSRHNVPVGPDFPEAARRRFGAIVESVGAAPAPIVVERATYWDAAGQPWAAGTAALATKLQ